VQESLKQPRVLFLDQTGQLGGAELCLADVVANFAERSSVMLFQDGPFRDLLESKKVKVAIVCPSRQPAMVSKSSGLIGILRAGPQFFRLALRVAREARRFDLIYANTAKALIVGGVAALLSRKPLLYHLHDIISAKHFSAVNRRLLVAFGNRAEAVVANSEATRRSFIESGGRKELTSVVHNGFDPECYTEPTAEYRLSFREEFGIGDAPCVLMVGRITPWKGQHLLLEAVRTLPAVHAIIAGEALFTDEDRQYGDRIMKTAAQPELAGRIHFVGFRKDLSRWYGAVDLVVHASTAPEPFGRVIVEGMLAGKPVIATRGGGASEILTDKVTGYLIAPGDARQIAVAIRTILDDPYDAAAVAERGREHARQKYSKEALLNSIEKVIGQVIDKRGWPCDHSENREKGF